MAGLFLWVLVWTGACYWHGVGGFMFNSSSSFPEQLQKYTTMLLRSHMGISERITLHRALHDCRPGFPGADGRLPIRPRRAVWAGLRLISFTRVSQSASQYARNRANTANTARAASVAPRSDVARSRERSVPRLELRQLAAPAASSSTLRSARASVASSATGASSPSPTCTCSSRGESGPRFSSSSTSPSASMSHARCARMPASAVATSSTSARCGA